MSDEHLIEDTNISFPVFHMNRLKLPVPIFHEEMSNHTFM